MQPQYTLQIQQHLRIPQAIIVILMFENWASDLLKTIILLHYHPVVQLLVLAKLYEKGHYQGARVRTLEGGSGYILNLVGPCHSVGNKSLAPIVDHRNSLSKAHYMLYIKGANPD